MNEWTKWVDRPIIIENAVWLIEGKTGEQKKIKGKRLFLKKR